MKYRMHINIKIIKHINNKLTINLIILLLITTLYYYTNICHCKLIVHEIDNSHFFN